MARGAWTEPAAASRRLWEGPLVELLQAGDRVVADDVRVPTLLWCEELADGRRRWRWEMRGAPAAIAARVGSGAKKVIARG